MVAPSLPMMAPTMSLGTKILGRERGEEGEEGGGGEEGRESIEVKWNPYFLRYPSNEDTFLSPRKASNR